MCCDVGSATYVHTCMCICVLTKDDSTLSLCPHYCSCTLYVDCEVPYVDVTCSLLNMCRASLGH